MHALGLDNKILRLCTIVLRVSASLSCFLQNIFVRMVFKRKHTNQRLGDINQRMLNSFTKFSVLSNFDSKKRTCF